MRAAFASGLAQRRVPQRARGFVRAAAAFGPAEFEDIRFHAEDACDVRGLPRIGGRAFAQLVVEEVARSLDWPVPEEVEQELVDLGLIKYVRDFLPPDWKTKGELRDVPE